MEAADVLPVAGGPVADHDDGDFGDWDSQLEDAPVASFLDAGRRCRDADAAWEELKDATGWDFAAFRAARRLGDYDCVRLVNALRTAQLSIDGGPSPAATVARLRGVVTGPLLAPESTLWTDDAWLRPALGADDGMITAVLAGGGNDSETERDGAGVTAAGEGKPPGAGGAGGVGGASGASAAASRDAEPDGLTLVEARAAIAALRATLARLVAGDADSSDGEGEEGEDGGEHTAGAAGAGAGSHAERRVVRVGAPYRRAVPGAVASPAATANVSASGRDVDSYYFDSYAHSGIHADMLRDAPRTLGYRDALTACAPWFAGGTVMDVGCGTGILSMFAARAGARRVWALDASSIAEAATAIVQRNGLGDVVRVVRGKVEDVQLPGGGEGGTPSAPGTSAGTVDVIVSEWMGYALLYESMLASVLTARDRFLRPGGRLIPSHAGLWVAALHSPALWHDKVAWWEDVYGFDMSHMGQHAWDEPLVETVPAESVASSACHLRTLALATMTIGEVDIVGERLTLRVKSTAELAAQAGKVAAPAGSSACAGTVTEASTTVPLHGLVLWFDTWCEGVPGRAVDERVMTVSTAPSAVPTHWYHTTLLFHTPLHVRCGGEVAVDWTMVRDGDNPRTYRFNVTASVDAAHTPGGVTGDKRVVITHMS